MSEFKFACLHCGQKLSCDTVLAGSRITCPACQRSVVVPWAPPPARSSSLAATASAEQNSPAGSGAVAGAEGAVPQINIPPVSIPPLSPPEPAAPVSLITQKLRLVGRKQEQSGFSKLAVAAFALALLGPLGFLPAIVCGHWAHWHLRKHRLLRGQTLATAGLAIGYTSAVLTLVLLARSYLKKL